MRSLECFGTETESTCILTELRIVISSFECIINLYHFPSCMSICVQDQFCSGGGGLNSLARIFSPLLARKSSGFARILLALLPENCYLKTWGGGGAATVPLAPWPLRIIYMCLSHKMSLSCILFLLNDCWQ